MADILEYFNDFLIQHGKENNRVYLIKPGQTITKKVIDYIETLASENNYTKIFLKIPLSEQKEFINMGYTREGFIPRFFKGTEDCCFLVKYLDESRSKLIDKNEIESVISASLAKKTCSRKLSLPEGFEFQSLNPDDAENIASLYQKVFKTYPFPIFDPKYIQKTMSENIIYFGIKKNDELTALSSAEIDYDNLNAEMTDFATHKEYRGKNFSLYLLQKMEDKIRNLGIKTTYTIARSLSYGMNITFAGNNYNFGGILVNNTGIYGRIESMNVWYKNI